jgi:hypothetical protein
MERKRPKTEVLPPGETVTRQDWAERINGHWRKAAESILATCRDLIAAEDNLLPSEFETMISQDLAFTANTAYRLKVIGRDYERLFAHVQMLPPHWGTIHVLARVPVEVFSEAAANGIIHPEMERADALKLLPSKPKHTPKAPPVAPEIEYEEIEDEVSMSSVPRSTTRAEDDHMAKTAHWPPNDPEFTKPEEKPVDFAQRLANWVLRLDNRAHLKRVEALLKELQPSPVVSRVH